MTRISTGTVTVTNGSKNVTAWVGDLGVTLSPITAPVGSQIVIDGVANYVEARPSTTSLTLVLPHTGVTGTLKPAAISAITTDETSIATLNQRTATVIQELSTLDANGRGLFYNSIGVTGNSDPSAGNLSFNSNSPTGITQVYLDNIDANDGGKDVSGILEYIPSGSILVFRSLDTNSYYAFQTTNGAVDEGGYYSIQLLYIMHDGILSSEPLAVEWRLAGKDNDSDVTVNDIAARAAYDAQPSGFRVFVSNIGDGRAARYTKLSNTSGDWSTAGIYTGPIGPVVTIAEGTTTTLPTGATATFDVVPVSGGYELNVGLPRGEKGDVGDAGPPGPGLEIGATGNLAGRTAYDSQPAGFAYVDDVNGDLYIRNTATPGVWSSAIPFGTGPAGASGALITTTDGVGNGTAGPYLLDTAPTGLESVLSASVLGLEKYDYVITGTGPYYITFGATVGVGDAWQVKQSGPLAVGTASAVTAGIIDEAAISNVTAEKQGIVSKLLYLPDAAGGVSRSLREKLGDYVNLADFGAAGNGTLDDWAEFQDAVEAAAGRPLFIPSGTILSTHAIDLCDATQLFPYRPGAKIIGQGIGKTKFLHNTPGPYFKHMVTEVQGASNFFTRGLRMTGFEIIADGSTDPDATGIDVQGTYHPWFHDIQIHDLKHGIHFTEATPGWAGTPNPDRYAVADAVVERCDISGHSGYGLAVFNAACQLTLRGNYLVNNKIAAVGPHGSVHAIYDSNSISGNGEFGVAKTGGIVLYRHPVWGAPQNVHIHNNEIDANRNRQISIDGNKCVVEFNRFNDDPTWFVDSAGEFLSPYQVEIAPEASSSANDNRVNDNTFRFTNIGTKNVTCVRFNMAAIGDRNMHRNLHYGSVIQEFGGSGGVVTEHAEVNTGGVYATGNRWATVTVPIGTAKSVVSSRDMTVATGTQDIIFGFKPARIVATAWVVGSDHKSEGSMNIDGVDSGLYYYPTAPGWFTHSALIQIRTGAGDIYDGTATILVDGIRISWVKTGSPTGTIDFKIDAWA